jgi:hypothetical protein
MRLEHAQERDAFLAGFAQELSALCSDGAKRICVIDPGHDGSSEEQALELHLPKSTLHRQPDALHSGKPIRMKSNVLGLVAKDEVAHLLDDLVARAEF